MYIIYIFSDKFLMMILFLLFLLCLCGFVTNNLEVRFSTGLCHNKNICVTFNIQFNNINGNLKYFSVYISRYNTIYVVFTNRLWLSFNWSVLKKKYLLNVYLIISETFNLIIINHPIGLSSVFFIRAST